MLKASFRPFEHCAIAILLDTFRFTPFDTFHFASTPDILHFRRSTVVAHVLLVPRRATPPLYNRASYFFSDNSATPGKVLPSNNSKEAPPPVETWLNSSSLPA